MSTLKIGKGDMRRPAPSGSRTGLTAGMLLYTIVQPSCTVLETRT